MRFTAWCLLLISLTWLQVGDLAAQSCGDCNRDGSITVGDALRAAQIATGLIASTPADLDVCDVDSSGAIVITDALFMAQEAVGLSPALSCPGGPINQPPEVAMVVAVPPLTGDIAIDYQLSDAESNSCSITVAVSTDGGATFPLVPADGPGGDGRVALSSSPAGTLHTWIWDSLSDLGPGVVSGVVVRITPSDAQPGTPGSTAPFTVDNPLPNTPPTVSGVVLVSRSYPDDIHSIWSARNCTGCHGSSGGLTLSGSATSAYAELVPSRVDLGTPSSSLILRKPLSGSGSSHPVKPFASTSDLDYQEILAWITQGARYHRGGDISIGYDLADAESDPCLTTVAVSTDGGASFPLVATDGPGGDGRTGLSSAPGGQSHTYVWDSTADLPGGTTANVAVRITPEDAAIGTPGTSLTFTVDNTTLVSYSADVHPIWSARNCTGCHGSAGGLTLSGSVSSAYAEIVPSRVDLGTPSNSLILRKPLSGSGSSHPVKPFSSTSDPDYQTILAWITQGAPSN